MTTVQNMYKTTNLYGSQCANLVKLMAVSDCNLSDAFGAHLHNAQDLRTAPAATKAINRVCQAVFMKTPRQPHGCACGHCSRYDAIGPECCCRGVPHRRPTANDEACTLTSCILRTQLCHDHPNTQALVVHEVSIISLKRRQQRHA